MRLLSINEEKKNRRNKKEEEEEGAFTFQGLKRFGCVLQSVVAAVRHHQHRTRTELVVRGRVWVARNVLAQGLQRHIASEHS